MECAKLQRNDYGEFVELFIHLCDITRGDASQITM